MANKIGVHVGMLRNKKPRPRVELTSSEMDVLIRLDLTNAEIGEELGMNPRTVEARIQSLVVKLKQKTRTAIALEAIRLGLIQIPGCSCHAKRTIE